jgi:hypothetical protein
MNDDIPPWDFEFQDGSLAPRELLLSPELDSCGFRSQDHSRQNQEKHGSGRDCTYAFGIL